MIRFPVFGDYTVECCGYDTQFNENLQTASVEKTAGIIADEFLEWYDAWQDELLEKITGRKHSPDVYYY